MLVRHYHCNSFLIAVAISEILSFQMYTFSVDLTCLGCAGRVHKIMKDLKGNELKYELGTIARSFVYLLFLRQR